MRTALRRVVWVSSLRVHGLLEGCRPAADERRPRPAAVGDDQRYGRGRAGRDSGDRERERWRRARQWDNDVARAVDQATASDDAIDRCAKSDRLQTNVGPG